MPIGQLITLGVGTPSNIAMLDLTGLYPSQISPNQFTPEVLTTIEVDLVGNVVYALGPRIVSLEWYSAVANVLEVSVDNVNWITLDSTTGNENRAVDVTSVFIRPVNACKVICRKTKKL